MKKILLTILLALIIWSCGSRKVEKQTDKVDVKIEKEVEKESVKNTEIKKDESVNTNTKETTEEDEKVIEPIDPTKEMIVDGKSYTNAKLTNKKTSKVKDVKEEKKASGIEKTKEVKKENEKEKLDLSQKSSSKKTDRKESFWYLWLLLLLIPLYYLYRYLKRKATLL